MKRLILLAATLCGISISAGAQWYLFPVEKETKEKKDTVTVKVQTPQAPESKVVTEGEAVGTYTLEDLFGQAAEDFGTSSIEEEKEEFVLDIPEIINVTLLLPMQLSGKTNANFIEMYCGAMLAARDLGKQGVRLNLTTYDSVSEDGLITPGALEGSDVIIGPVSTEDILNETYKAPGKFFVSPLDPKAMALADSSKVIQAPSTAFNQADELVRWLVEESVAGDDIVLLRDTVRNSIGENAAYLISRLEESGLRYKTSYLASNVALSSIGNTRFVIASDRDAYIATAVRQIGLARMKRNKDDIFIYGTSKVRNAKGVETKYLYSTNSRITMTYAIDYADEKVKDFILSYRALFKDEPASFAFQGYDAVHYFTQLCAKYGRKWYLKLADYSEEGLQSNFRFEESDRTGNVNRAVRRVTFNRDSSMTVQ